MIDLQYFVDTLPLKYTRNRVARAIEISKFPYKIERALRAYAEHDALHYLFQQPFTEEGEKHVAYLEKTFNRGWLPFGEKYNVFTPKECDCGRITVELIDETADIIYWTLEHDETIHKLAYT
jgi:hypothetical protein